MELQQALHTYKLYKTTRFYKMLPAKVKYQKNKKKPFPIGGMFFLEIA